MSDFYQIEKLVELFNPNKDENSDSENEDETVGDEEYKQQECKTKTNKEKNENSSKKNPYAKIEPPSTQEAEARVITDPYDEKLFFDNQTVEESGDWRKCPKWDISYRQRVTASDVYLQMGNKGPATASCENMIVSVHMPGENRQNIDLKVTKERLDVVSPNFKLELPLPQPVDPQRGNAQWDKDTENLIVTLYLEREFDYINF